MKVLVLCCRFTFTFCMNFIEPPIVYFVSPSVYHYTTAEGLFCLPSVCCAAAADGRFSLSNKGLIINNITQADNGEYTCRAEVEADGRYEERKVAVEVHSKWNCCLSNIAVVFVCIVHHHRAINKILQTWSFFAENIAMKIVLFIDCLQSPTINKQ